MTIENLNKAIIEARKFLERAIIVQKLSKENQYLFYGTKETGAVKRASMDLSRALSQIRK